MVAQWAFVSPASSLHGAPLAWEAPEGNGLLQPTVASSATEMELEAEMARLVDGAYARAVGTLRERVPLLELCVDELCARETLSGDELAALVARPTVTQTSDGHVTTLEVVREQKATMRVRVRLARKRGKHRSYAILPRRPRTAAPLGDEDDEVYDA